MVIYISLYMSCNKIIGVDPSWKAVVDYVRLILTLVVGGWLVASRELSVVAGEVAASIGKTHRTHCLTAHNQDF